MRRNVDDKWQQRIAWHELGHAIVGKKLGLAIGEVVHSGEDGKTTYSRRDDQWHEYAVFCMAGSVGEWLWEKHNNGGFGSRAYCQGDLAEFKKTVDGRRLSESDARAKARKILRGDLARIRRLAPELIRTGRLSGSQI